MRIFILNCKSKEASSRENQLDSHAERERKKERANRETARNETIHTKLSGSYNGS